MSVGWLFDIAYCTLTPGSTSQLPNADSLKLSSDASANLATHTFQMLQPTQLNSFSSSPVTTSSTTPHPSHPLLTPVSSDSSHPLLPVTQVSTQPSSEQDLCSGVPASVTHELLSMQRIPFTVAAATNRVISEVTTPALNTELKSDIGIILHKCIVVFWFVY